MLGDYIVVNDATYSQKEAWRLEELKLNLPPLPEQRAIAHILGSLNDKIELNRRENETLEAMARALFKSWFVDFDPVHAKAALKQPQRTPPFITPPLGGSRRASAPVGGLRRQYTRQTLQKARALRQAQTDAEGLLWHYLRGKRLGGYKFRRQQPIGPYIVDFACLSRKLLIEVDGGYHVQRKDYDERRDRFLRNEGYRVLRFWNNEVFEDCFGVLERVYAALEGPPPPPEAATPSRGGSDGEDGEGEQGRGWTRERARAYLDKMEPSIAGLFPDHFVDSELGELPAGWEVKTVGAIASIVGGTTPSTKQAQYWKGGTHCWATPKDLASLSVPVLLKTERKITDAGLSKIGSGLLPPGTVLLSSRAPIGYLAVAETPVAINQGFIGILPHEGISNLFMLYWSEASRNEIINHANGSTFLEISKGNFRQLPVVVPDESAMKMFDSLARPLYNRIVSNERQSRTLAALRDALLPKLISGEIRVNTQDAASEAIGKHQ